jgi:hypothetical protein
MSEQFKSELERQIDICKKSLNYDSRFQPAVPGAGTTNDDGRFTEIERAAGVTGGKK